MTCWSVFAAELLPRHSAPARAETIDVVLAALLVCSGDAAMAEVALVTPLPAAGNPSALDLCRLGESPRAITGAMGSLGPYRAALTLIEFDRVHWAAADTENERRTVHAD